MDKIDATILGLFFGGVLVGWLSCILVSMLRNEDSIYSRTRGRRTLDGAVFFYCPRCSHYHSSDPITDNEEFIASCDNCHKIFTVRIQ